MKTEKKMKIQETMNVQWILLVCLETYIDKIHPRGIGRRILCHNGFRQRYTSKRFGPCDFSRGNGNGRNRGSCGA